MYPWPSCKHGQKNKEETDFKYNDIVYNTAYVESRKIVERNLFGKQKKSHKCRKQNYGYQGGKWGQGWDELGDWNRHIYTLLCIKQITNENLLYSTENSTQCSVVS